MEESGWPNSWCAVGAAQEGETDPCLLVPRFCPPQPLHLLTVAIMEMPENLGPPAPVSWDP